MTLRAVGLVTEYNPFHNGHAYHARLARERSGADVVVAVMSGHYVQRGEPALVDKWRRAEMALRHRAAVSPGLQQRAPVWSRRRGDPQCFCSRFGLAVFWQ